MDVSAFVVVLVIIVSCSGPSSQLPQDIGVQAILPVSCVTAKGLEGGCVYRPSCNFGTSAVDLTLYSTKGHTTPCKEKQVCCPSDLIVEDPTADKDTMDSSMEK